MDIFFSTDSLARSLTRSQCGFTLRETDTIYIGTVCARGQTTLAPEARSLAHFKYDEKDISTNTHQLMQNRK